MRLGLNQAASGTLWKMDPVKLNLGLCVMKLKIRSKKDTCGLRLIENICLGTHNT